jgi:hypothetical protein
MYFPTRGDKSPLKKALTSQRTPQLIDKLSIVGHNLRRFAAKLKPTFSAGGIAQ